MVDGKHKKWLVSYATSYLKFFEVDEHESDVRFFVLYTLFSIQ